MAVSAPAVAQWRQTVLLVPPLTQRHPILSVCCMVKTLKPSIITKYDGKNYLVVKSYVQIKIYSFF